ncbi:unnamed protein product [Caenorhabditis bovis]|uniref:Saposin B-type domain-containing protein n=1 Tax=Caenorhabditis bovis TaxID=2654633 RepID=A0A8S1F423_9PELO|nr:unnamed protein product [Caenorhabditis bovis]
MRSLLVLLIASSVAFAAIVPPMQASLECITCVATVKGVEAKVFKEGDEIGEKEVHTICMDVVPVPAAEKYCESYGDKEVELIISDLKKDVPPKDICKKMHKC